MRRETCICELTGETKARRGPKPDPNATRQVPFSMAPWERSYLDLWPGNNPSEKMRNLFEYVYRMRPHGPSVRPRDTKGRYVKVL